MVGNLFLIGPMGVGKTSVGRNLANHLSREFIDSDQYIEKQTGAPISWIFDIEGESGFRERELHAIDTITQKNNIVLSTGGGSVVLSQTRRYLQERGTVIFLYTDLNQQFIRTRRDEGRPLLQTENVKQRLVELWRERLPLYKKIADHRIDTTDKSINLICKEILEFIDVDSSGMPS